MQTLLRFLVVCPFVVLRDAPNHAFLTVQAGSIIEADHEPIGFGLCAVTLAGQEFWAFTRDLQECCSMERFIGPSDYVVILS
jgi:hypothetical protein